MTRFITLALHQNGTGTLIHGPEVPASVQRATVQKHRDTDTPDGVERVEIWARPTPPIKFACRKPAAAKAAAPAPPAEPPKPEDPPKAPEAPQPPAKPAPAPAKPAK